MGQDDDSKERRVAERVAINSEFSELPGRPTYVSDLSESGVFVHTVDLLPVGTVTEVRFTVLLDDPVTIVARGTVIRSQNNPIGMGIEFGDLPPETVLKINDVVSRRRPWSSGPPLEPSDVLGEGAPPVASAMPTSDLHAVPVAGPDGASVSSRDASADAGHAKRSTSPATVAGAKKSEAAQPPADPPDGKDGVD